MSIKLDIDDQELNPLKEGLDTSACGVDGWQFTHVWATAEWGALGTAPTFWADVTPWVEFTSDNVALVMVEGNTVKVGVGMW